MCGSWCGSTLPFVNPTQTRKHVFIVCSGAPGTRTPTTASLLAPRWGPRVRLPVDPTVAEGSTLHVLHRSGHGDLVVACGLSTEKLEEARKNLGRAAESYTITPVPVVLGPVEMGEPPRRRAAVVRREIA
jgi:hypothetical protein